jgi:hypothetical protein
MLFQIYNHIYGQPDFMVIDLLKEKITLSEARASVAELTNVTVQYPCPSLRNINLIPF